MIEIVKYPPTHTWASLLQRPVMDFEKIEQLVQPILEKIQQDGDKALLEFNQKFDGVNISDLAVSEHEFEEASHVVADKLKAAINIARINIEKFHIAQRESIKKVETMPGVNCWRKSVAINKVGLYIPGGTAPLFSTLLMLGVPANIAGCEEIVVCTPANKDGKIHPAILYTAQSLGIKKVFKTGGAQAIAAMAYGTEQIPKVYKIFGPGNQYVTAAKQLINKQGVAIDMPAGPSEVMVIADNTTEPAFVASDLLSQAEHGADSQVVLVCNCENTLNKTMLELMIQLEQLPRKEIASKALKNSKVILVDTIKTALELCNHYAPEHLILQVENPEFWTSHIINAGSVFMGKYTPESAGDYASGTNHTLPTNGFARAYSGVSLDSFVKKITFQNISSDGLKQLGPVVEEMAHNEGLYAHKNAVSIRLKHINDNAVE